MDHPSAASRHAGKVDRSRSALRCARWLWLAVILAGACQRERPVPAPAPRPAAVLEAHLLPDRAPPLVALGDTIEKDGFLRRVYGRQNGDALINVTLARLPSDADGYRRWLNDSANYPQASLPIPSEEGNGFFTCAAAGGACDLHVQLRAGVHVEIMGQGRASRPEIERIAKCLPWGEIGRKLGSGSSPVPGIGPGTRQEQGVPAPELPR